ncbi:MAG TPA: hypothetical protein VFK41_03110 [Nocardioidaceae bacterium]|nr:hypothetical protein [Nocardioidaceae bacterium]
MQRMGLRGDELAAYHRTLQDSHTVTIKVGVLNLAGKTLNSITPILVSGQVMVDVEQDVSRALQIELHDPRHALHFDSRNPSDGALFADRLVRIYYTVHVPELERHVTAVPFTGPVNHFERNGDTVSLEAQGMEALALRPAWRPRTVKKGTPKVEAIQTFMSDRAGESRFAFPDLQTRLPKPAVLGRRGIPWKRSRKIASTMNRQLYYPGTGVCTLRRWPQQPCFTFSTGDGGSLLSDLAISYTLSEDFANVIEVIGGKPRGPKERPRYVATPDEDHPLSPQNLGRNGVPGYVVETIHRDDLRSNVECRRVAERALEDRIRETIEVSADVLPMPHFDEGDLVTYDGLDGAVTARLRRWVLPLHTEGDPPMSVGYDRNTVIRKRRIRRA